MAVDHDPMGQVPSNHDLVLRYLEWKGDDGYKRSTLMAIRYVLAEFIRIVDKPLGKVEPTDIVDYVKQLRRKRVKSNGGWHKERASSVRQKIWVVRAFYEKMISQGCICPSIPSSPEGNPVEEASRQLRESRILCSLPSRKRDARRLTWDDLRRVYAGARGSRDKAVVALLAKTGLSVHEVCDLRIDDIDFERQLLRVRGRRGRERVVFLDDEMEGILRAYLGERPFSFEECENVLVTNAQGDDMSPIRKISRSRIYSLVREAAARAGYISMTLVRDGSGNHRYRFSQPNVSVTPRLIRRSFANILKDKGCPRTTVSIILGHKQGLDMASHDQQQRRQAMMSYLRSVPRLAPGDGMVDRSCRPATTHRPRMGGPPSVALSKEESIAPAPITEGRTPIKGSRCDASQITAH